MIKRVLKSIFCLAFGLAVASTSVVVFAQDPTPPESPVTGTENQTTSTISSVRSIEPGKFTQPIASTKDAGGITTSSGAVPFTLMSGYFNAFIGAPMLNLLTNAGPTTGLITETEATNETYIPSTMINCFPPDQAVPPAPGHYPRCALTINTNSTKKCPEGFTPFLKTSIVNSRSFPGLSPFACPISGGSLGSDTLAASGTTHPSQGGGVFIIGVQGQYAFRVLVAAVPSTAGNNGYSPAVSFNWELMCYPSANTPRQINAEQCASVKTGDQLPILLWDQGYIADVLTAPTDTSLTTVYNATLPDPYFYTHRQCPAGYAPVIELGQGYAVMGNAIDGLAYVDAGISACFQRLGIGAENGPNTETNNTPAYRVYFLVNRALLQFVYTATSLQVRSETAGDNSYHGIDWKLMCYPPGLTAPNKNNSTSNGTCTRTWGQYIQ